MNYIANFSVVSREVNGKPNGAQTDRYQQEAVNKCHNQNNQSVFCQADLWNLQKRMRRIHVTDRFPRTWEGVW